MRHTIIIGIYNIAGIHLLSVFVNPRLVPSASILWVIVGVILFVLVVHVMLAWFGCVADSDFVSMGPTVTLWIPMIFFAF